MIKVDDLKKIIKLVLLTGDLKNQSPVSLLIVGKSGMGKTELISSFKKKTIDFFTDLTYTGLIDELMKNPKVKHIIIPDFIKITEKRRATTSNLISLLNALIEEGLGKLKVWKGIQEDFKGRKVGLITATTMKSYSHNQETWNSFGFVQRMLIVSYDYDDNTVEEIIKSINKEEYIRSKTEKVIGLEKDIKSSEKLNAQLNAIADKNFRNLKILQKLAKANALLNKRTVVNQEDISEIIRLSKFMNLNYTKI